jgi:hypothetical protein
VLRCVRKPPCLEAVTSLRLKVDLVYDPGCPNVDGARDVLTRALQAAGAPAVWSEWSTEEADCPDRCRGYGSPTILVNGKDVAPGPHEWKPRDEGGAPRCRVYETAEGLRGWPPLGDVQAAVERALAPHVV